MADVFLSYSRRDSDFVRRLADALEERGKDVWVDVEGIRDGEVFPAALRSAVEASDSFVFVISPDSVHSTFCEQEVDHAVDLGKRIVPLVHRRVPDADVPQPIRERNWVPFETDTEFDDGVNRLVTALDTDLEHTNAHTHWLVKALEWDRKGRDRSMLVRGSELADAERWLADGATTEPEPTALQYEYVQASRVAATRRLRVLVAAMAVAVVVAASLAVVALSQRNTARHQTQLARSRALAALSENQLQIDPELSVLLGEHAVKTQASPQAMLALREGLDALLLRKTLIGHKDSVAGVAFSPDGKLLASASPGAGDMSVRIWDAHTGRQLRVIYPNRKPGTRSAGHARRFPNTVVFDPSGKNILVGLDSGGVAFYAVRTGKLLGSAGGPDAHVNRIHFTADGRRVLVSGVGPPVIADTATSRILRQLPLPGHNDQVFDSSISFDGRFAAMANPDGYAIWDTGSGRIIRRLHGSGTAVAFAPHDERLAFGGHAGLIEVVDGIAHGQATTVARLAPAGPNRLAWSPDGRLLSGALTDGTARIWNVDSGDEVERLAGHRCCVLTTTFSPDGRLLATGAEDHKINVWSAFGNALEHPRFAGGKVNGLAFTAAGRLLIRSRRVALSRDGSTVAVAGPGPSITLTDAASGDVKRTIQAPGTVHDLAFDGTGTNLAVATSHGAAVIAVGDGAVARRASGPLAVGLVAYAPTGVLEAIDDVGRSGGGGLWLRSRDLRRILARVSSPGPFTAIAVSPDGKFVAAAARADPGIRIFDRHLREVRELLGHISDVTALAWSRDSRLLASAGNDGTVRLWDPSTGDAVRIINHQAPVTDVALNAKGNRLAFGDHAGSVEVWDGCAGCFDPKTLLKLARARVSRTLTPLERRTFLKG